MAKIRCLRNFQDVLIGAFDRLPLEHRLIARAGFLATTFGRGFRKHATPHAPPETRAISLREHGASVRYYHDEVGYNYRMEGIQGAVLNVKLPRLPEWTQTRRKTAHRYHELLSSTPLVLPREAPWAESVYHVYVVRHPKRDKLREHLLAKGVGTALHYPLPLHLQKCFSDLGHKTGDFPVSEQAGRECISLPIYPEMSAEQVDYVASMIREFASW